MEGRGKGKEDGREGEKGEKEGSCTHRKQKSGCATTLKPALVAETVNLFP